jgi:hypothetical protein
MPVRHARSETRGRPPLGRRGGIGKNGSTRSHNGSESSVTAIAIENIAQHRVDIPIAAAAARFCYALLDIQAGSSRWPLPNWLKPRFREQVEQANHDFLHPHRRIFSSVARELIYRTTLWFIPPHGRLLPDERLPFAYRPLVEFMLGLDWEHIVRPDEDRVIMRRALRGILPETLRTRGGKSNHCAPIHEGLRAAWPRIGHLLTGECLAELGVVEPRPFKAAIETMRAGYPGRNSRISYTALYLESWMSVKAAFPSAELKMSSELGEDLVTTQQLSNLTTA